MAMLTDGLEVVCTLVCIMTSGIHVVLQWLGSPLSGGGSKTPLSSDFSIHTQQPGT